MNVLRMLIGLLPASRLKNLLIRTLAPQWRVAEGASIGPCLLWRVGELRAGRDAVIGTGNVFRDMASVSLGAEASISNLNWFSGSASYIEPDNADAGSLVLERGAAVTSRHYFDCSGGVLLGELTTVGGVRTTIISHSVDVGVSEQQTAPVRIGARCLVSSGVFITAGISIADRIVVGAGSVVVKDLTEPESLYAGTPARRIRSLAGAAYFDRPEPRVAPRREQPHG